MFDRVYLIFNIKREGDEAADRRGPKYWRFLRDNRPSYRQLDTEVRSLHLKWDPILGPDNPWQTHFSPESVGGYNTRPEKGLQLRKKANHEIIRQYRCTVLIHFDWLIRWDIKCVTHSLTELEMAINTWVAFATKKWSVSCLRCQPG